MSLLHNLSRNNKLGIRFSETLIENLIQPNLFNGEVADMFSFDVFLLRVINYSPSKGKLFQKEKIETVASKHRLGFQTI